MEITSQETVRFTGRVGKPASDIVYVHVIYHDKEYTVMKIKFNNGFIKALIDKEDFIKVKDYSWHYIANGYVSHGIHIDGSKKELLIHNMVMSRLGFPGHRIKESIDHINRNGLDNRKENLRLVTQSAQLINQKQRERRIELPADSGVNVDEIPKHIWYIKANGSHGERFGIDLKTENVKWKSTSAKNVSLQDKLKAATEQLKIYYQLYPYLNPEDETIRLTYETLTKSYEDIVGLVE